MDPSDATSEEDQKAEGVEEADLIKYYQDIKLFNTSDYMGKSKGLSMNYNKNMKLELFKVEGEDAEPELLETFQLDDLKEQYNDEVNYNLKQIENEKKRKEDKKANQTDEEKAKDKTEEEEDAPVPNPKVKLSIEFSRSGYLLLTKATVGVKDRQ